MPRETRLEELRPSGLGSQDGPVKGRVVIVSFLSAPDLGVTTEPRRNASTNRPGWWRQSKLASALIMRNLQIAGMTENYRHACWILLMFQAETRVSRRQSLPNASQVRNGPWAET
jgi:hypothetical protein